MKTITTVRATVRASARIGLLTAFLLAAASIALPADGWAQIDAPEMQTEMQNYFEGERLGGVGFMTVGLGSVVAGGFMYASDSDFYRGMSYPMLGLGAVQLLIGGIVILQAGPRIDTFTDSIAQDPTGYLAEERPRMDGVQSTFSLLFVTELVLITGGITAALLARRKGKNKLAGISAGLATQAALILGQDIFASRRARQYTMALDGFQLTVAPQERSYRFSFGGRF